MKLNLLAGILLVMIIVNIAAVDTYLYFRVMNKPAGSLNEDGGHVSAPAITNEDPVAGLDDSQREKLRALIEEYKRSTGEMNGRIRLLDDEIFRQVCADSVNNEAVDRSLQEITTIRQQISRQALSKIIATKAFLTKAQQEQLFGSIFRTKSFLPTPQGRRYPSAAGAPGQSPVRPEVRNDARSAQNVPPGDNRLKKYQELLKLSDTQSAAVRKILEESRAKYAVLKATKGNTPNDERGERKVIMDTEDNRVLHLLSDSQKKVFQDMKNRKKQERPGRKGADNPEYKEPEE